MKKYFVKLMSGLLHSSIHQVMWYSGAHSESILPFMHFFFLSRELCFLRSPCLLLITKSISLDTSGKPTVGNYWGFLENLTDYFRNIIVNVNMIQNPCHVFNGALCDNNSRLSGGVCCRKELPDQWGWANGSVFWKRYCARVHDLNCHVNGKC